MIRYFAYGSNMNISHLRDWISRFEISPDEVGVLRRVLLPKFRFRTNYLTVSGRGAANIEPAEGQTVEGVLIPVTEPVWMALRVKEGWPRRYEEIEVDVFDPITGQSTTALTYSVSPTCLMKADQIVRRRYRNLILEGAGEAGLSSDYQAHLSSTLICE